MAPTEALPAAHLFDAEYSLMELVWEHAPVGSTRLAALAGERLGWKKSTTYTVLRKLAGRGVLENRSATVRPLITRQQALRAQAAPVVARCGGLSGFLTAFFEGEPLSEAEADQLQALIDASRARRETADDVPGKAGSGQGVAEMEGFWLALRQLPVVFFNLNLTIGCALAALLLLRPLLLRLPAQPRASLWVDACWLMPVFTGATSLLPTLRWGLQGLLAPRVTESGPFWLTPDSLAGGAGRPLALPGGLLLPAPGEGLLFLLSAVWLAGMVLLALLSLRQTLGLRRWKGMARRLDRCDAAPQNDPDYQWALETAGLAGQERGLPGAVWECEGIPASCVANIGPVLNEFVILLQAGLPPTERRLVLLHELLHLKLLHCSWKGIFWIVLILHWYNPLIWLAYRLFCRDLETACDEAVLRAVQKNNPALREAYAEALLHAAQGSHYWLTPTAFGETDAAGRIRHTLAFRPSRWRSLLGWAAAAAAAAFVLLPAPARAVQGDAAAAWGPAVWQAMGPQAALWSRLDGPPETDPSAVWLGPVREVTGDELDPGSEEAPSATALVGLEYPDGRRSAWQCFYIDRLGEWRFTTQRESVPGSWTGWRQVAGG